MSNPNLPNGAEHDAPERNPVDAWFDGMRNSLVEDAQSLEIELAEAADAGEKKAYTRLWHEREVLETRNLHLLELAALVEPDDITKMKRQLGDHLSELSKVLTSQNVTAGLLEKQVTSAGQVTLGYEEKKIRKKIGDTMSLMRAIGVEVQD